MKLTPYKKLLTLSKEQIDSTLVPTRARAAKAKAELESIKLEETIATLEHNITELCSQKDLNLDSVVDRMDELALAERRKEQFQKIVGELFPE